VDRLAAPSHLVLGGLSFRLSAGESPLRLDLDPCYRPFLRADPAPPGAATAVAVDFVVSHRPSFSGQTIFESTATWSILAHDGDRAIEFRDPSGEPLYVAEFRPGSPRVTVRCSPHLLRADGSTTFLPSPFHYPLDQILTMYLLGGTGVVVHAAGALVGGKGIALAGISGAGKSTFMSLAAGRPGWQPLSDDRVIARLQGAALRLHGSPWPGEGRVAENRSGDAAYLFFLHQAAANDVKRLTTGQALERLLRTVSIPWYDTEYLGSALAACGEIVSRVSSAELWFRPEPEAVDLVERVLAEGVPT
jgi:hypothetical protein